MERDKEIKEKLIKLNQLKKLRKIQNHRQWIKNVESFHMEINVKKYINAYYRYDKLLIEEQSIKCIENKKIFVRTIHQVLKIKIPQLLFRKTNKIQNPPGGNLNKVASFLFYEKTYNNVFKPVISDMQNEYFEALSKNEKWKARWRYVSGICIFWKTFMWHPLTGVVVLAKKVWTMAK